MWQRLFKREHSFSTYVWQSCFHLSDRILSRQPVEIFATN
jgi:hypothetical protein